MTGSLAADAIAITLNGEPHQAPAGSSIAALLRQVGLDPARVAVEHNRAIAPRSQLEQILIHPGDQLEVVHFVGGG